MSEENIREYFIAELANLTDDQLEWFVMEAMRVLKEETDNC